MNTNIAELVKGASSIRDLEGRLQEQGLKFETYHDFVQFLTIEWDKVTEERRNEVAMSPMIGEDIPTTGVEIDNIQYLLHGIVHGHHILFAPGWHPRRRIRHFVSENVVQWDKPENFENYFYEEGLGKSFCLSPSRELQDQSNTPITYRIHKGLATPYAARMIMGMTGIFALPLVLPIAYATSLVRASIAQNCKPKNKKQLALHLSQMALHDPKYLKKCAAYLWAGELPQPLNLEIEYLKEVCLKEVCDRANKILEATSCATSPERSLWTAKQLRSYATANKVKKLHYLGGLYHITEIAYFLQHPEYSFEQVEAYRRERK